MKMKKKIVVASLVIALLAIAVGGSLAWFTANDEVKNVFTVGSVVIEQNEDFVQESQLLPVVGEDPTDADDNYIKKAVTVENTGINSAYVQTYVAVPAVLDNNGILKLYDANLAANGWSKEGVVATGISIEGETIPYNVYLYRYDSILAKDVETAPCLEYVYIDKTIDLNTYDLKDAEGNEGTDGVTDTAYFVLADGTEITGFNAAGNLNVYVATQAVQADGFDGAEQALESAFKNHPWATN